MFTTILIQAIVTIAAIIVLTRLHGVRSFSKMSGFDFAITVSVGSVLASTIMSPDQSVWVGVAALVVLFGIQIIIAQTRARSAVGGLLDNAPIMVMESGQVIDSNLKAAGMTHADLWGKLREANAYDLTQVQYVIAESTGDVSVLHGDGQVDARLLDGVRRRD